MDVATRSGTSSRSMGQLGSKDEGLRSEDVEPLSRAEFVALQHSWLAVEGGDSLPPPPPDDKRIISHEQLSVRISCAQRAPWPSKSCDGPLTRRVAALGAFASGPCMFPLPPASDALWPLA